MKKLKEYVEELLDFSGKLIEDNQNDSAALAKRIADNSMGDYQKAKADYYNELYEIDLRTDLARRIIHMAGEFVEAHK